MRCTPLKLTSEEHPLAPYLRGTSTILQRLSWINRQDEGASISKRNDKHQILCVLVSSLLHRPALRPENWSQEALWRMSQFLTCISMTGERGERRIARGGAREDSQVYLLWRSFRHTSYIKETWHTPGISKPRRRQDSPPFVFIRYLRYSKVHSEGRKTEKKYCTWDAYILTRVHFLGGEIKGCIAIIYLYNILDPHMINTASYNKSVKTVSTVTFWSHHTPFWGEIKVNAEMLGEAAFTLLAT